jgi:catechol 2,3-dioxygenase-like lactoylglutathione lyase family enzyme
MNLKTTNEAILRSGDLDAVKAYYSGHLGFKIVLESDSMIGFDTGAFNVYFERGEPNGAVFEFLVEDLSRTKNDLIAAGCLLLEENPAVPRIYFRDPFGLAFNISEA